MTDTRTALEKAFKVIHPEPPRSWKPMPIEQAITDPVQSVAVKAHSDWRHHVQGRFRRFLDAEAWTDAAIMLVPEKYKDDFIIVAGAAYLGPDYMHYGEGEADYHAHAETPALALAAACLKAKEQAQP